MVSEKVVVIMVIIAIVLAVVSVAVNLSLDKSDKISEVENYSGQTEDNQQAKVGIIIDSPVNINP